MARKRSSRYTFVAVSYGGEAELLHFEQTKAFWSYFIDGKKIQRRELLSVYDKNTDELIGHISDSLFDVVIARNFGAKAMARLKEAGIKLYTYTGGCDAALKAYLNGELKEL